MFIIIIFITITQQPEQDRWAETAGLSSLNEYEYENVYENGMRNRHFYGSKSYANNKTKRIPLDSLKGKENL